MAQLVGAGRPLQLALLAGRPLGVDEQAEALLEAKGGGLGGLELMVAGVGHGDELHGVQLVEGLSISRSTRVQNLERGRLKAAVEATRVATADRVYGAPLDPEA